MFHCHLILKLPLIALKSQKEKGQRKFGPFFFIINVEIAIEERKNL